MLVEQYDLELVEEQLDEALALKDAAVAQLTIARQERDAAIAERDALREEVQRQRNAAIAAQALLAEPSELQKRVLKAESVSAELREGLQRYEVEYQRMIAERDALRDTLQDWQVAAGERAANHLAALKECEKLQGEWFLLNDEQADWVCSLTPELLDAIVKQSI